LNTTGNLDIQVTRPAEDSTLARLVKMIETSRAQRAKSQRFLESFETYYAWAVVAGTGVCLAVPWLWGEAFETALYRAMALLVVASPCALVISTPAAILSAIARGARNGVLFKGGVYIERMAHIRVAVFDKTGTLTTGKPGVTDVVLAQNVPQGFTEDDVLAYAAALESRSEHVLAREITLAAERQGLQLPEMDHFVAYPGRGIHARLNGYLAWLGGDRMFRSHGEPIPPDLKEAKARLESEGKTVLVLHRELERHEGVGIHEKTGGWLGLVALQDTPRPDARATIDRLKAMGVEHTVMLTGDNPEVAHAVAAEAGIDSVYAGLSCPKKRCGRFVC